MRVNQTNKGFTLNNTSIVKLLFDKKTDQKQPLQKNKVINNVIADNFLLSTRASPTKTSSGNGILPKKEVKVPLQVKKTEPVITPKRKKHWYEKEFKMGVRTVGGKDYEFRSSWENNYALYLQMLLEKGIIIKWEYEPEIFVFEGIKRGTKGYLPDFKVTWKDGRVEYHEIKGHMDAKSKVKLKRFAEYFPEIPIRVISTDWFNAMKTEKHKYPGWEN